MTLKKNSIFFSKKNLTKEAYVFMVENTKQKFWKIVNVFFRKKKRELYELIFAEGSLPPLGYGLSFIAVNFGNFLINSDRSLFVIYDKLFQYFCDKFRYSLCFNRNIFNCFYGSVGQSSRLRCIRHIVNVRLGLVILIPKTLIMK